MTPVERAETFAMAFRGNANSFALGYGGPVYLVGSYLNAEHPGDIDIRLVITHADAEAMFGEGVANPPSMDWCPAMFAKAREQLKQSRRLSRRFRRWGRVDFQFAIASPVSMFLIPAEQPRIRLDSVPDAMFDAGRGEP